MGINQTAVNWVGREIESKHGDTLGAAALIEVRRDRKCELQWWP